MSPVTLRVAALNSPACEKVLEGQPLKAVFVRFDHFASIIVVRFFEPGLPTRRVFGQTVRSMNRSHLLAAIIFLCLPSLISAQSVEFNGLWLGYEPFKYKGRDYFYQNRLSIKDGVVRLVKRPEMRHTDGNVMEHEPPDGGLPVFRGRLVARGNVTVAVLEIESCDECDDAGKKAWHVANHGVLRQGAPKDYPIQVNSSTSLKLDGAPKAYYEGDNKVSGVPIQVNSRTSLKLDGVTFRRVKNFPPINPRGYSSE